MPFSQPNFQLLGKLLEIMVSALVAEPRAVVASLRTLAQRLLGRPRLDGMYEVLEYEACLELKDVHGEQAVYSKRQRVRFLQDNIIAYQDKAWGDGDIFADYRCAPGVAVDRYREGHRYRILISLRETKRRGEIEEFYIQRTIQHGFTKAVEDLQTEIDHVTRTLSLRLVFPAARVPKQVRLIEQNRARTVLLASDHFHRLPDGRWQVTWHTDIPMLFEAYILRWEW